MRMMILMMNGVIRQSKKEDKKVEMTMKFNMDNDSFQESMIPQIHEIMENTAGMIEQGYLQASIFDVNGNKIGYWDISE